MNVQIKKIDQKKQELGYPIFRNNSKDYNLNVTFLRNPDGKTNHFDDIVVIDWWDLHNTRNIHTWEITTDPGLYWLKKPMNVNGTAIVCHDQFVRGAFIPGYHRGYKAMVQNPKAVFKTWRDNDLDNIIDYGGKIYTDVTGLNWHHAYNIEKVGPYSAGCQVQSKKADQKESYEICEKGYKNWGPISACWLWGDFLL
jgi:hypothetical protein